MNTQLPEPTNRELQDSILEIKVTIADMQTSISDLRASVSELRLAMQEGFAFMREQFTYMHEEFRDVKRRLGALEVTVAEIREELSSLAQAFDRDSETLLDHGGRIIRLERHCKVA